MSYGYDAAGNRKLVTSRISNLLKTNPIEHRYRYDYDGTNRVQTVVEADVLFDASGNATGLKNATGQTFQFDANGNRVFQQDYTQGTNTHNITAGSGEAGIYDALTAFATPARAGQSLANSFDARNRLTEVRTGTGGSIGPVTSRRAYDNSNALDQVLDYTTFNSSGSQIARQRNLYYADGTLREVQNYNGTRPRLPTDHRLADGTIRHYVSLIASRILSVMVTPIRELDGEDLEQAYLDVAALAASTQQRGRVVHVLRGFDRFVRQRCIADLPQARLPGFGSDRYAISARVVSFAEYQAAFDLLGRSEIAIANNHLRHQSKAFLTLAFRGGLRRGEILGLTVDDLRLIERPVLHLRHNRIRRLKTSNAQRNVPLGHLTDAELECLRALVPAPAPDSQPLFFVDVPTVRELDNHPVVPIINRVLARTTGDTALHPHNLRHALATTIILGMLGPDVGIDSHPWVQPWMIDCLEPARQVHQLISGALHRRAGRLSALSMMVGHGSERTTCEHYIHCLDLLHFFAATRDLMLKDVPMTPGSRAWLTAALGYSGTTKISERTWDQASRLFVRAYEGRIEQCTPTAIGSVPVRIRSEQISLEGLLMEHTDGADGNDLPKGQVWRDAASEFINTVNLWLDQDAVAATKIIELLARHRLNDSHWSSVKLDTLKEIVKLARILGIPLESFDVKLVNTPPGSRVRMKSATTLAKAMRARNDAGIKYWLLIRDRPRGIAAKRSDMQSHVTWVLMRSWRRLVPVSS